MPSFSSATLEMRCSFAACAMSMSDGITDPLLSVFDSAVELGERAALAIPGVPRPRAALGQAHGAVLELRDLAERVEHRIGQQVRRCLVEGERNEHRAARRACVRARIQRDLAAPRLYRDEVSRLD